MKTDLNRYMLQCKQLEDEYEKYSLYVHGYFLPWLQQQREAGSLQQGRSKQIFHHTQDLGQRKVFIGSDDKYEYTGELDKDGNACGFGIAVGEIDKDARYESTWFQNKRHGIGERDNSFIFKLSLCRRIVHQQS